MSISKQLRTLSKRVLQNYLSGLESPEVSGELLFCASSLLPFLTYRVIAPQKTQQSLYPTEFPHYLFSSLIIQMSVPCLQTGGIIKEQIQLLKSAQKRRFCSIHRPNQFQNQDKVIGGMQKNPTSSVSVSMILQAPSFKISHVYMSCSPLPSRHDSQGRCNAASRHVPLAIGPTDQG